MSSRFFVDPPVETDQAVLDGPEAHHAIHVMRCRVGDELVLFDGSGVEFTARIQAVERARLRLEIVARHEIDREAPRPIVLGVALPKGDRQRWLVEKAVELGVARLVPLITERGVAQPVDRARERLERTVIEASKQCGRNRLLRIDLPLGVAEFCGSASASSLRVIAHFGGRRLVDLLEPRQALFAAIGPEGGFSDDEVAVAVDCGWRVADLGERTLRVETAALAIAAWAALDA